MKDTHELTRVPEGALSLIRTLKPKKIQQKINQLPVLEYNRTPYFQNFRATNMTIKPVGRVR